MGGSGGLSLIGAITFVIFAGFYNFQYFSVGDLRVGSRTSAHPLKDSADAQETLVVRNGVNNGVVFLRCLDLW